MSKSFHYVSILSSFTFVAACASDAADRGGPDDAHTEVTGSAVYRDAETQRDGTPRAAAQPDPQDVTISVYLQGSAEIPELDPACALDASGEFQALFAGQASLDEDGAYAGLFGEGSGAITTPSGCAIPELELGLVTDVRIRAELAATVPNCSAYCEASARADAEAECGASADAATCRAEAEAAAAASCNAACVGEDHVIVAEASLAASLLGELDAEALQAAALGELQVDLVFDHVE